MPMVYEQDPRRIADVSIGKPPASAGEEVARTLLHIGPDRGPVCARERSLVVGARGKDNRACCGFVAVARSNSKSGHVAFETENEILTGGLDRATSSSASEHATGSSAKPHISMPAGPQQGSRRLYRPARCHRNRKKRRPGTARMSDSSPRSTICRKGFRKPRHSGWCQDAVNTATIARIYRGFSVS